MKVFRKSLVGLCSCLMTFPVVSLAQEISSPSVGEDASMGSKVELAVSMVPDDDDNFSLSPLLRLQYGSGSWSAGVALPFSVFFSGDGDDTLVFGNPTLELKGRICIGADTTVCLGGSLSAGFGFQELDKPEEVIANAGGIFGHQDFAYHLPETMVIQPMTVAAVRARGLSLQGEIGPGIFIPFYDSDQRDAETVLNYQVSLSYEIVPGLAPFFEFRGINYLSGEQDADFYWLNAGARMRFGDVEPMIRLSFPLTRESGKGDAPVQLQLGFAYRF